MTPGFSGSSLLAAALRMVEFVSNILESSTECFVMGIDLDGRILLWNRNAKGLSL